MGEVYRASDTNLGRQVAIKVLPEAVAQDAERLARFDREARTLAALNHPNIAQIYGIERSNGVTALVMELVEGRDLSEIIAQAAAPRGGGAAVTPEAERVGPEAASVSERLREGDSAAERRGWASLRQGSGGPPKLQQRRGPAATKQSRDLDDAVTSSRRTPRPGIPLSDALAIARQIAEALEAAHEQGIIHRDLKPANIKVRADGTVKVLDFGLAKALGPEGSSATADLANSPTITTPAMTAMGMILGTAAYMAPEQAKGRAVDKRADIWAFGVVLYEMLTGQRAFDGEDVADVLSRVLQREPDFAALPSSVPARVRQVLHACLQKNPKQRLGDMQSVRLALEGAFETDRGSAPAAAPAPPLPWWRRWLPIAAALALGVLATAAVGWTAWPSSQPGLVRRYAVDPPPGLAFRGTGRNVIALAPDGSAVVYNTAGGLYLREAGELQARLLPGTEAVAMAPAFSPDGREVAYFQFPDELRRISTTGGAPVVVAAGVENPFGLSWADDNTMLFGQSDGIYQVPAIGGSPERVIAAREGEVAWDPQLLPDGESVLFTAATIDPEQAQVVVQTRGRDDRTVLVQGGSNARYLPTGHLIYAQGDALFGIAFDPGRRTVSGGAVLLVQGVQRGGGNPAATAHYSVAAIGDLIYVRDAVGAAAERTLAWVDRQGRETAIAAPARPYGYPRVSPDGTRIAVESSDGDQDLWVWDLNRTTLTRVTFTPAQDGSPVWSPDGRRLFFRSARRNIFAISADGTGTAEQLTTGSNLQTPSGLTPDGTQLLFFEILAGSNNDNDVLQVEVAGSHTVTPLVQNASAFNGVVSPDGRWLAYNATDSGSQEIYVRPYPDVNSARWQVSTRGGRMPVWSPDGRELFYVSPARALMRVGVERGTSWTATTPALLLPDGAVYTEPTSPVRTYDIAPDGQRFLVLKEAAGAARAPQVVAIAHLDELLKRLLAGP